MSQACTLRRHRAKWDHSIGLLMSGRESGPLPQTRVDATASNESPLTAEPGIRAPPSFPLGNRIPKPRSPDEPLLSKNEPAMATHKLFLLPGDGIGPEVMAEAEKVIRHFADEGVADFGSSPAHRVR